MELLSKWAEVKGVYQPMDAETRELYGCPASVDHAFQNFMTEMFLYRVQAPGTPGGRVWVVSEELGSRQGYWQTNGAALRREKDDSDVFEIRGAGSLACGAGPSCSRRVRG